MLSPAVTVLWHRIQGARSNSTSSPYPTLKAETRKTVRATTFTHLGSYRSIPSDASSGLVCLRYMLPAPDSLGRSTSPLLGHLSPDTHFIVDGGSPVPAKETLDMLAARVGKLSEFYHEVKIALDVEKDGGKRNAMYESVSVTVLRNDPEKMEVKVPEPNIVELERTGGGISELQAVELRSCIDAKPDMQCISELAKREAK